MWRGARIFVGVNWVERRWLRAERWVWWLVSWSVKFWIWVARRVEREAREESGWGGVEKVEWYD